MPPIAQPLAYHRFADARTLLGLPNFWNVLSNLPFLLVGLAGLRWLLGHPGASERVLRPAWLLLFAGVALVGLGSAWYHLAPSNGALVWDRLPMTLAFMALFSVVIGEHISLRLGRQALWPLLVAGVASVLILARQRRPAPLRAGAVPAGAADSADPGAVPAPWQYAASLARRWPAMCWPSCWSISMRRC